MVEDKVIVVIDDRVHVFVLVVMLIFRVFSLFCRFYISICTFYLSYELCFHVYLGLICC